MTTTSCESKYSRWSDQALHQKARTLPLRQRYDFYLKVYAATFPHRTTVADDIAALGDPAWRYTIHSAINGGYYDAFDPAIPVLIAFDRRCSTPEYKALITAARRVAPNKETLRLAIGQVGIGCNLVRGTTLVDYEKLYPKK